VLLFNEVVSNKIDIMGIIVPAFESGLDNYYQAHLVSGLDSGISVMTMVLDDLNFDRRISCIKIDAEGHEGQVLAGMYNLIERDHPVLMIETGSEKIVDALKNR
jgi:FkbM family methyltransferase